MNGTIVDAWQLPLTDVGIAGEDQGKGGKYLLLPPDYRGDTPAGYITVPMKTYNSFVGLRVITKSEDEASVRSAPRRSSLHYTLAGGVPTAFAFSRASYC